MFLILAALIGGIVLIYKNSYNGIVSAGNKALERQEYSEASSAFQRAIGKNKERPEAYTGLSRVYLAQNDPDAAESVFLDAIEEQAGNSDLYGACIDFYIDTKQQMEIPDFWTKPPIRCGRLFRNTLSMCQSSAWMRRKPMRRYSS